MKDTAITSVEAILERALVLMHREVGRLPTSYLIELLVHASLDTRMEATGRCITEAARLLGVSPQSAWGRGELVRELDREVTAELDRRIPVDAGPNNLLLPRSAV